MGVLVLIVGSSTCLALDHPLDPPTSLKAQVLEVLDVIFTCLFTMELLCKIGAFGLYKACLLYTSPSPRDGLLSRMPSSA